MEPILSPNDLEQLKTLIDDAHHIVVCCHTHPDGDAIGSCLGWTNYLRSKGKEAVVKSSAMTKRLTSLTN